MFECRRSIRKLHFLVVGNTVASSLLLLNPTPMTSTTPLLRCAQCGGTSIYDLDEIERDRGDWIRCCPDCQAENVLAYPSETLPIEIAGWRGSN
ncbi:MAG: hypothetical protein ABI882_17445, partial [Acidobacteriota bacterium]